MNRLRYSTALAFAWLLLFYNIERFHEPINIASFVYVYAACIAMAIVAMPRLRQTPSSVLLPSIVVGLIVLKWIRSYEIFGTSLPLTITEATSLAITFYVARTIARGIEQFEDSASDVLAMHPQGSIPDFTDSQVEFYREVRRAREFERPLTLLAIKSSNTSDSVEINRFLEEMQRNTIRRHIDARIGHAIADSTRDCDMLAYSDDHFVLLLPEVDAEQASQIISNLNAETKKAMGVELQIGHAVFPAEEVTLSGLLDRAVSHMQLDLAAHPTPPLDTVTTETNLSAVPIGEES